VSRVEYLFSPVAAVHGQTMSAAGEIAQPA
jgi:hypothetical protein